MSALAAIFDRMTSEPDPAARDIVSRMLDKMRHRGPHGVGVETIGSASLGHRMCEQTPQDVVQPIISPDGQCAIIADARIDNRDDLAAQIELAGDARDSSDAAYILAAYQKWGEQAASKLVGAFAFVIWDNRERKLYAARDQLGVRPLFFHEGRRRVRIVSEPAAIFVDPDVAMRADRLAVALYVAYLYSENDRSLYAGVRPLPAAHYMVCTRDKLRIERYWRALPQTTLRGSIDDNAERYRDMLLRATRCRMRSPRPLAITVSGGMDSSSVAVLAETLRRQGFGPREKPTAMHLEFPGEDCDETPYSHALADQYELPRVCLRPMENWQWFRPEVIDGHRDVYYSPQQTMMNSMIAPVSNIGARTILTGLGGDFLLRPTWVEWADDLRAGRLGLVAQQSGLASRPWSRGHWGDVWRYGIKPLIPEKVRVAARPFRRPRAGLRHLRDRAQWAVHEKLQQRASDVLPDDAFPDLVTRNLCRLLEDFRVKLALVSADRSWATKGLTCRHPLLDLRLLELVLALPHEQRHVFGKDKPKPILRHAVKDMLPRVVHDRTDSATFTPVVEHAIFGAHGPAVSALFANSRLVEAGILTPRTAEAIKQGGDDGVHLTQLINTIGMEIWLRHVTF